MMIKPSRFSAIVLTVFVSISQALAQPDTSEPAVLLEQLTADNAEIDAVWQEDLRSLAAFGDAAMPPLAEALKAADTDQKKTTITYLMNVVITQARYSGGTPITIAPDVIDLLSETLMDTDALPLGANIVNTAGIIGPEAAPMAPAIISFLRNHSDENARATAQAVLGRLGKDTLPLIHEELREPTDERVLGDLAQLLGGTQLPADILEALENLLRSEDPNIRKQAMSGLEGANADQTLLLDAAIRNLDDARTDSDRIQAAYDLTGLNGPRLETVSALQVALEDMQNRNEREQLEQLLDTLEPQGGRGLPGAHEATDGAALKPSELRQAMIGESFAYRGQLREGAAATGFAEGYIFALAERSSRQDVWCGFDKLLPHELLERVFESLAAPGDVEMNRAETNKASSDTENDPTAAEHVVSFLKARFPCNII